MWIPYGAVALGISDEILGEGRLGELRGTLAEGSLMQSVEISDEGGLESRWELCEGGLGSGT